MDEGAAERRRLRRDAHERFLRRDCHRHRTGRPGARRAAREGGPQDRDHRAQALRRHLRQQRLHSDQGADRKRARRARRADRRRVGRRRAARRGRRHARGQGAQGRASSASRTKASPDGSRKTPGLTVIEAHARFEGPHTVRAGDALLEAPQIFVNVGGPRERAAARRNRRGAASRQRLDDGHRCAARRIC